MNRRHFIQATVSALFISPALTLANAQLVAAVPQWEWTGADWFFYDGRFPQARLLATQLSGATALTPVQGDITGIWNAGLGHIFGQSSLTLQGVTTESFHFCLNIMLGEQTRVEKQVTRIDRDLFLWQIRCGQAFNRSVFA